MHASQERPRSGVGRSARAAGVLAGFVLASGCGAEGGPATGPEEPEAAGEPAVGEVTPTSDDSTATSPPLCVGDIPDDLSDCGGPTRDDIARVELDGTRKATLQLPAGIVGSWYRVRLNGVAPLGMQEPQDDRVLPFQVPADVVALPGPTTVTVQALSGTRMPKALWRFELDDPAGPPA